MSKPKRVRRKLAVVRNTEHANGEAAPALRPRLSVTPLTHQVTFRTTPAEYAQLVERLEKINAERAAEGKPLFRSMSFYFRDVLGFAAYTA